MLLSTLSYLGQLATVLAIFVAVLLLTFFTTRFLGRYQKGKSAGSNLEVVETLKITTNKYLQIVKVGERYLVIGIGKEEIHMLAELSADEVKIVKAQEDGNKAFREILERAKQSKDTNDDEE